MHKAFDRINHEGRFSTYYHEVMKAIVKTISLAMSSSRYTCCQAICVVSADERGKLSKGVSYALDGMRVIQVFPPLWQEHDQLELRGC
jgi:hypothetical protein